MQASFSFKLLVILEKNLNLRICLHIYLKQLCSHIFTHSVEFSNVHNGSRNANATLSNFSCKNLTLSIDTQKNVIFLG